MSVTHPNRTHRFQATALLALGLFVCCAAVPAVRADEPANYWLGIALELPGDAGSGIRLQEVLPGSPAAKAGLREGDLLLKVGGEPVRDFAGLQQAIRESGGKPLAIELLRDGKEHSVWVVPGPRPEGGPLANLGHGESREGSLGEEKSKPAEPPKAANRPGSSFAPKYPGAPKSPGAPKYPVAPKTADAPKAPTARQVPLFQPRMVLPVNPSAKAEPFPDDLSVFIQKKGNHPAELKVVHGKLVWQINEDETDKLPASIRGHVQRMLPGRGQTYRPTYVPGELKLTAPRTYVVPAGAGADGPLQREVQELKRQMRALEAKVDALGNGANREAQAGKGKKPGAKKPDIKKADAKKSDAKKPDAKKPDVKKPGKSSK